MRGYSALSSAFGGQMRNAPKIPIVAYMIPMILRAGGILSPTLSGNNLFVCV
jgi:hypothetical protein